MNYISPKDEVLKVKRWPKDTIAAGRGHTVTLVGWHSGSGGAK